MLLQRLREYEDRASAHDDAALSLPPEYKRQIIPWVIRIDAEGSRAAFVRTAGTVRRENDLGKEFAAPFLRRQGTNIKPQLLADKAEFVLGLPDPQKPDRAGKRHSEFVAVVESCAQRTKSNAVAAVSKFLAGQMPAAPNGLEPTDLVTFQVENEYPIDEVTVKEFWANLAPRLRAKGLPTLTSDVVVSWMDAPDTSEMGICLVCGEMTAIARTHPTPIRASRSVSDQQLSIVSANKEAFWSYGLEQSYLAPTCTSCAEAYARGANRLIASDANSLVLGGAVFLSWTRDQVEFDPFDYVRDPKPGEVQELLRSVRTGRERAVKAVDDETAFYATSLSGSGGRAVVRDWIDTTVGEAKEHLSRWFILQRIVGPYGEEPKPLGLYPLAAATVRDARDLSPPVPRAMLSSALAGTPLPTGLLFQAVKRNRAEQGITRPRAALIKAVWLSNQPEKEDDYMVQLDPDNDNAAYRCGRLLAVLERAQQLAISGVNATIVDRFFGTASSAPESVFPRLIRGAQPHLAKLERDRRGAARALQRRIEEILEGLPVRRVGALYMGFPTTLSLADQGLFSLGYYHERAFDRAQRAARRASGEASGRDDGEPDEADTNDDQPSQTNA